MEGRDLRGRFDLGCKKVGKIQVERPVRSSILYNYLLHLKHVNPIKERI